FPCCLTPPAPPKLYTLSLHDALPISMASRSRCAAARPNCATATCVRKCLAPTGDCRGRIQPRTNSPRVACLRDSPCRSDVSRDRSEEHTSELQSRENLVCRLLLEKKK